MVAEPIEPCQILEEAAVRRNFRVLLGSLPGVWVNKTSGEVHHLFLLE
jgi:hypothetical protein